MPRPVITLTTDFGLSDHFVGVMKGVILGICPTAELVDITHEIGAYEITEGAFVVGQSYRHFPKKTVHLVVVDPGVGSSRRPLLVEAAGQSFIAPDNGVLSFVYSREKARVRAITNAKYFLKSVSQTFHGRDVFAPCAARLAKGAKPATFGPLIQDFLRSDFDRPARTARRAWTGTVLKVDRFGNLITNFQISEYPNVTGGEFSLAVGPQLVTRRASSYAEMEFGEPFLIAGSSGFYEVSLNQDSAALRLGCGVGAPLELTLLHHSS